MAHVFVVKKTEQYFSSVVTFDFIYPTLKNIGHHYCNVKDRAFICDACIFFLAQYSSHIIKYKQRYRSRSCDSPPPPPLRALPDFINF